MDALLAVFLVSGVTILSVALGVVAAYCAISGLLAAFNPARNARSSKPLVALVAHQSQASGD